MTLPVAVTILLYALALFAGVAWLVRRHARTTPHIRPRPMPLATVRRDVEPESPIIGWIIRDELPRPKSATRFREPR